MQILLEGGATQQTDGCNTPMQARDASRLDIVKLLVQHGFDPAKINMREVFDTWEPEIMTYFVENGADVTGENPLAYALCHSHPTSLRIFKRYQHQFPSFLEQVNIALRFHCKEGNLKWCR